MITPGSRLGAYEILSYIGAGGMGEVYKARDTRLDRAVALKVLPDHLSTSPELRQRFEREARTLSQLSHPNICGVYDVGREGDTGYLVMEFLEGESLSTRLARGALPLEQSLRYVIQIADALDQAHRHGIVHRDVKPGNVMLTKTGAKLLDFGLARVATPILSRDADLSVLDTQSPSLTAKGILLGTIPYLAPEQVEGREADARTDIWAMGCLLYEVVTGERPFVATSPASLIGAILKDDPRPMRELKPLTPAPLERLVKTCLARDPDERWQNAHDLAAELRWIAERQDEIAVTTRHGSGALKLAFAGGLGALLFAGLTWIPSGRQPDPTRSILRIAEAVRFTHETGLFESPSWSPDGTLVAFASNRSGNFEVYVRRADGGHEVNVTEHPSEDIQPAFSPDGARSHSCRPVPRGPDSSPSARRSAWSTGSTAATCGSRRLSAAAPGDSLPTPTIPPGARTAARSST